MTAVLWFWASAYLQTSLWHVVMQCNIGMHWVSCCRWRYTTVMSSGSLWEQSSLAKNADEGLESLFPLWHFHQKHSIACMQAALSRQVAYNMFSTHSPAGLYLMRWFQASSGHLMLCLESTEGPKPSSIPTGHNTGLLSKVLSALGRPEAMQQYEKTPRKK